MSGAPRHIGIIMDGNRRFSKRLMLEPWKGHEYGAKKVEKLLDWCIDLGIREVTLYSLSVQNFNRPKKELDFLINLFKTELTNVLKDPRVDENRIQFRFLGRRSMFPPDLQEMMQKMEDKTSKYDNLIINFAMGYGGREELIDAIKAMNRKEVSEEELERHLYNASEPDLIIRTGGEKRLSNFLLWQSAYAELIFLDIMWPEFEKEHLVDSLKEYESRQRRFGR